MPLSYRRWVPEFRFWDTSLLSCVVTRLQEIEENNMSINRILNAEAECDELEHRSQKAYEEGWRCYELCRPKHANSHLCPHILDTKKKFLWWRGFVAARVHFRLKGVYVRLGIEEADARPLSKHSR